MLLHPYENKDEIIASRKIDNKGFEFNFSPDMLDFYGILYGR